MEEWRQGDKGEVHTVETVVNLFEVSSVPRPGCMCVTNQSLSHKAAPRRHFAFSDSETAPGRLSALERHPECTITSSSVFVEGEHGLN